MVPDPRQLERFRGDLDRLIGPDRRIGIAISGGPDSLALLLLAAAARPQNIEAATVDHTLRAESRGEAEMVGRICGEFGIPHEILTVRWSEKPQTALQERGRSERYRLLAQWAATRGIDALATAHHLDDQAETLLMRLARGAGVRGLSAMRSVARVPGSELPLVRPLLGWRRAELEQVCASAGLEAVDDPCNQDARFERVRVRKALAEAEWLDPSSVAASAAHLGDADAALEWAAQQEWAHAVSNGGGKIVYRPTDAPDEIRRRIVAEVIGRLATEGNGTELRGREIDRLLAALGGGGTTTIRGVLCSGGREWRFARAPARRG